MTRTPQVASGWAPVVAPRARWRDQRVLERVVTALFVAVAAAVLLRAAALGNRLFVLDDTGAGGFLRRARRADDLVGIAEILTALAVLALAPSFITWMWRSAKNQQALGRTPERLGSGWAIGGWFIPLANFVIPVLVAQDLWRGSDAAIPSGDPRWRIADRSWLVGWWWGLTLVPAFGFAGADAAGTSQTFEQLRAANLLALFAMVAAAAGAVLGALVVRALDRRQEACRAAWGDVEGATTEP